MGGNALKQVETRRYQRDEYLALEKEVLDILREDFPGRRVAAIQAYREKESFGDMDVLLESDNLNTDLMKYVKERFNTKQAVRNSHVVSFEYKDFQIDLICTTIKNFNTSASYFAWNDLGNLMGRVAHKLGFKYGHEGLSMTFRDGDYMYAEVEVSRNIRRIVEFLGYNYDRFADGFDTVEEIFVFTASTPFFNKEIYSLENRNHTSRTRDRKRKTYNQFLTWIETAPNLPEYPWSSLKEQGGREYKKQFMERAFKFFPSFKEQHDKVQAEFQLWKQSRENFNGDLVREWTGLQDQDLGKFMKFLREAHLDVMGKEAFQTFTVCAGQEGVKKWLKPIYDAYVKKMQK